MPDQSSVAPQQTASETHPVTHPVGPNAIPVQKPGEVNGPKGLEPTRFGDWEINGRCSDF